ncbi:MAG: biopolymer transporter ExbD [Segetibacter sp.]|nr:biopolymer transporter ExbD [Segetibacter sp.]
MTIKRVLLILLIGFILIVGVMVAFFYFTIATTSPIAVHVPSTTTSASRPLTDSTLVLLLGNKQKVYAYYGRNMNDRIVTSDESVRKMIGDEKKKHSNQLSIVIKPSSTATYEKVVDILDEMTINDIKKYELGKITPAEEAVLKNVQ